MTNHPPHLVLQLSTVLDASRERVFAALTEPTALARWWGPAGFTMADIELDPRVGCRYRFSMQPPQGEVFHLGGEFLTVEVPSRLVYSFDYEEPDPDDRETVVELSLAARGAGTELALAQGDFLTEARLALHRDGWTDSFARLGALLDRGE